MKKPLDFLILKVRKQPVILDADLSELYGFETKRLNEQVKRNAARFPPDFMFQLTSKELAELRSQWELIAPQSIDNQYDGALMLQIATPKRGGRRTLPYPFTERGALMAANVLKSEKAVGMSVYVVRAFVQQRALLTARRDIFKRLAQIDAKLLRHDDALQTIWRELQPLLQPAPPSPKRRIGFHVEEEPGRYRIRAKAKSKTPKK